MMTGYEDALAATLAASAPLQPAEMAPLWELSGRVTALDLAALDDSPTADVSLKDGYAVQSADVTEATPDHPVFLRLTGQVAAGGVFTGQVVRGTAVRILSGAPLPAGATAVLAEEFTVCDGECIAALADAAPARNVMRRGSELVKGQCIIPAGTVLRPAQVGLLAAAGYREVPVVRRPRVGIVATGDEVVGSGLLAAHENLQLEAGQVFASNLTTVTAWCRHYGMATAGAVVGDDPAVLRAALLDALTQNDAVVTSGGAWSGERDLVVGTLEELGWRKVYHRIRLGPGKGAGFGLWQGKPVFVLPGGPASNQVAFLQLALPALHRLMGYPHPGLPTRPARLTTAISGQRDWTQFIEGRFEWDGAELRFVPGKGRSRLRSMADSEGYVKIPEGVEVLEAEALVPVQVLPDVPALMAASPAIRPSSARWVPPEDAGAVPRPSPAATERDAAPQYPQLKDSSRSLEVDGRGDPLIVSIVARSGMGKTTFLEKLLPKLKVLGLRVGILKHHAHATPFDVPGKDTFRMSAAGADVVIGVCAVQTAVFIPGDASADLEGVIRRHFGGMDLVITEGFKRGAYPKIEVYRAAGAAAGAAEDRRYTGLLCRPDELLMIVTDTAFQLPPTVPQFGLEDAQEVAQFLAGLATARHEASAPALGTAAEQARTVTTTSDAHNTVAAAT